MILSIIIYFMRRSNAKNGKILSNKNPSNEVSNASWNSKSFSEIASSEIRSDRRYFEWNNDALIFQSR